MDTLVMTHKAIFDGDKVLVIGDGSSEKSKFHLEYLFSQLVTTFEWQRINSFAIFICKQNDFHIDSIYFLKMKKIHLRSGSPSDIQMICLNEPVRGSPWMKQKILFDVSKIFDFAWRDLRKFFFENINNLINKITCSSFLTVRMAFVMPWTRSP